LRKAILALIGASSLAAAATAVSTSPAEAWGGCGPYRHPTPWGCRWNGGYHRYWGGPAFVVGPAWGWHRGYYHRPWGWGRHYW